MMSPQQQFPQLTKVGVVTTPFGGNTQQEGFHPGVDIANANGTPVPAFKGGVVEQVVNGRQQGENNFGNSVIIKDADGNRHQYSHLKKGLVKRGQKVQDGQMIAQMGNSGAAYSPSGQGDGTNLDYRIVNAYGQFINPERFVRNI